LLISAFDLRLSRADVHYIVPSMHMSIRGVIQFLAMLPLGRGRRIGRSGRGGVPSIVA
jgi:hypothetical protein